ncbi:MAG: glycosyltransferase [Ignavibacteriae bacterium]|nr:glycosyltransferase [Ignavibacteriota bacterium]
MKILILGTAYPLRGGIAHYNALLAKHLGARHNVEVITFKRQYPTLLFPGKSQQETGDPGVAIASEQLIDSINPFNWIRVGLQLSKRRPDLVVFKYWLPFFGPCMGTICRLIKRGTSAKVIAICDNVIPHEHRPGDGLFTRYAFGTVDAFIVQSSTVERDLLSVIHQPRYQKVAHPVYEIFGTAVSKEEARRRLGITAQRVVLFFGYIRKYKGLHVFIDAMKLVNRSVPVKALAVGEFYEDDKPYREHIQQAGVEQSLQLVAEYIPNERVAEYFCAADVVVLPYLSATQSGIAQIAYQFDKPVIATDVGGLAEVVIHGVSGFIVPPNDPQQLADAIVKFYQENLERSLSVGAKQEKRKYSWDVMVEAIEALATDS